MSMSTIHICNQKSGVRKNTYLAGVTRGCLFGQQTANTEISALPQHRGSALMACRGATPCSLRSCKRRTNATSIRRSRLKEEDEERRTSSFFLLRIPLQKRHCFQIPEREPQCHEDGIRFSSKKPPSCRLVS